MRMEICIQFPYNALNSQTVVQDMKYCHGDTGSTILHVDSLYRNKVFIMVFTY